MVACFATGRTKLRHTCAETALLCAVLFRAALAQVASRDHCAGADWCALCVDHVFGSLRQEGCGPVHPGWWLPEDCPVNPAPAFTLEKQLGLPGRTRAHLRIYSSGSATVRVYYQSVGVPSDGRVWDVGLRAITRLVVGWVADLRFMLGLQLLLQEGGGHVLPGQQLGRVRRLAPRPRPVGLLLFPCVARPASCSQRNCVAAPRQQHMLRAPAALFASVPLSNVAPELRVSWLQSGRAAAVVSRHAW